MNRIRLLVSRDFRRRLRSPAGLLILMVIPILMTALFGVIFAPGDKDAKLTIRILVVDLDRNFGARMLNQVFQQERFADMFRMESVTEEAGRREIARGKASALLIIPRNFTADLFLSRPTRIEVIKNPAQTFLPRIVEEFTRTMAVFLSAAQAVFAPELAALKPLWDQSFEDIDTAKIAGLFDSVRPKVNRLRRVIDPPLVGLAGGDKEREADEKNESVMNITAIFAAILPGMAIMFMMFIVETFMREIMAEKEDGTLRRLLFSPIPPVQYVTAKIISAWTMGLIIMGLLVAMGKLVFGIQWGNLFHLAVYSGAVLATLCGLFALLNAFLRNRNQAGAVAAPVILMFSAFGGSMIPVSQLPGGIQALSRFTPNFWFIQGTAAIRDGGFLLTPALILSGIGVLLTLISLPILVRRLSR